MRLYEINLKDDIWKNLNNVDEIHEKYHMFINLFNVLLKSQSLQRNNNWLYTIELFESELNDIINLEFADENDPDVIKIKSDTTLMKNKISELKAKLRF